MLFYFLSILSKINAGRIDEKKISSAKSKITDCSFLYNIIKTTVKILIFLTVVFIYIYLLVFQ